MPIFSKGQVIPHSEPPDYSLSLDEFIERLDADNNSQYQQLLKTKQEQLKQVMQTSVMPGAKTPQARIDAKKWQHSTNVI
jgi:hypothetical protein